MKLTTVLLIVSILQVSASTFAQKVNLSLNNAPLKEVMNEIRSQTGYDFVFNSDVLKEAKPVSLDVENAEFEDVLKTIFSYQPLKYRINNKLVVVTVKKELSFLENMVARFRSIDVKGRILDENSIPLSGATVKIKGGDKLVVTDKDGYFLIRGVDEKAVLAIFYVGYINKEVQVQENLGDIQLKLANNKLEEVGIVSTGYQTLPKERATGSFSVVGQQRLAEQVGSSVISRLEGITPALTVDRRSNGGTMMIRGLSTLRSDRSPLIVLDDFPYEGDINNINPADVANITILKDAAAASIWGAKAGNGVIVITSKKGKYNEAMHLTAGAGLNILAVPDGSYNRYITASDLVATEQMLFKKGYYNSLENGTNHPALSPVVEMLIAARDGKINDQTLNSGLSVLAQQNLAENYARAFYTMGLNKQYYANVTGGTISTNWKFFAGIDDNKSVLSEKYRRYDLKYDQSWKPVKGLELGVNLTYTQALTKSGRSSLSSFTTETGALPTYTRFVDDAGHAQAVMNTYSIRYTATAGGGKLLNWDYYPLDEAGLEQTTNKTNDFIGGFKASYQLLDGLSASFNYLYEKQLVRGQTDYDEQSYYTRDRINLYTQISSTTVNRPIPLGAIRDQSNNDLEVNNVRTQLNYDKAWKGFMLNILSGVERRVAKTLGDNNRVYGFDTKTLSAASVDYANAYENFVTGSSAYIDDPKGFTGTNTRFVSLYANGAISYSNRYMLSASVRRDGSNLFGVNTNNKWSPLWSAGLSWLISDEVFAKGMPYTRLRLTYGSSGNASTRFAAVTTISYDSNSPYTQSPSAGFSNYANPDLQWETVKTLNLAADFRFLNDRLTGSVDYYVKKGSNLIGNAPMDYTAGVGFSITKNAAKISGRGLDIELNSQNLVGAFRWTTDFFMNFYKDKVDEYYLPNAAASNFINGDSNVSGIVDMPVYAVYGFKWAGLNPLNGNPRGYINGDISEDYTTITGSNTTITDLDYVGRAFPTSTGSMGNSFGWKGFNLDFRIGFKFGYYFRRPSLNYSSLYASRIGDVEYAQRWQTPGDELHTNIPSEIYPAVGSRDSFYNYSTVTIIKGDHIRFQSIGLGYTFSKKVLKTLPFQNLIIQFQGNNLGLIWYSNKEGIDPDYPVMKPNTTYSLSVKINF